MQFLVAPFVVGIVFYFIYLTFELFVRKQERISLIEKMGQNISPIDPSLLKNQFGSLLPTFPKKSFTALRFGCLFVGIGLGLLIGLFIALYINNCCNNGMNGWERSNFYSMAYTAPVLFFGGLGLIISYLIERKSAAQKES
jgi:ABC-type sugar transport system permease subunit